MVMLWLKFIAVASVVVFSGYKICLSAEDIGRITGIGRTFVGLVLLATVTSLPELSVAISAIKIHALDLALGDLFGSNLFNLTIVGIIFLVFMKKPQILNFHTTQLIGASFSVLLLAFAAQGIIFYNFMSAQVNLSRFFLDVYTALILVLYILGAFLVFRTEKNRPAEVAQTDSTRRLSAFIVWGRFLFYSVILVGSAVYLSRLGNQIAQIPVAGKVLGGTFVGSLFIAVVTSLPEMAVSISAVRLGLVDMALGNIFGSNMFNMGIIPITDLIMGGTAVLAQVSPLHLFTALFVVVSTTLVLASLIYRSEKKVAGLAWDTVSIIFIYFVANLVNFYLR